MVSKLVYSKCTKLLSRYIYLAPITLIVYFCIFVLYTSDIEINMEIINKSINLCILVT